jgi:hypothetical protein
MDEAWPLPPPRRDSAIVARCAEDDAPGRDGRIFALLAAHARAVAEADLPAAVLAAQELAAIALERARSDESPSLLVGPAAAWFLANGGARVDLRRRRPLRLLLDRLVAERFDRPGVAVSSADLVGAGWPGETIRPTSASSRLYVTVHALRELGLREAILAQDGGYLLDPALEVRQG